MLGAVVATLFIFFIFFAPKTSAAVVVILSGLWLARDNCDGGSNNAVDLLWAFIRYYDNGDSRQTGRQTSNQGDGVSQEEREEEEPPPPPPQQEPPQQAHAAEENVPEEPLGQEELVPDPDSDNLYDRIGVQKDATSAVIKKAYWKAALLFHPDKVKNQNDSAAIAKAKQDMTRINEVKDILLDAEQRRQYDAGNNE